MSNRCRSALVLDPTSPLRPSWRRSRVLFAFAVGAALLAAVPWPCRAQGPPPQPTVDLLLVLAADISRSVDARKFKLQREGYASSLGSDRVLNAIRTGLNGRIAICFVEWSGVGAHSIVVDWVAIGSKAEADDVAARLLAAPRLYMDRTAIGEAIAYAATQFARSPFASARRVIDVSGDGTNNIGRDVTLARDTAVAEGITINGLAILSDTPLPYNPQHTHPPGGLLNYYRDNVIGGPGAFALAAESHEAFGDHIRTKLVREIAGTLGGRRRASASVGPKLPE